MIRAEATASRAAGGVPAPLLMVAAMLSFQLGAAVATGLFAEIGVPATAFLRTLFGGIVLVAVARPSLRRPRVELLWLAVFGVDLALLNVFFYEAIGRIPLGVAVTVEFAGPLSVALLGSRRRRDLVWVAMAALGVALFAGLPRSGLDPVGLAFAGLSGVTWAAYIFTAKRVGRAWQGSQGLAVAMLVSAVVLAPLGVVHAGSLRPAGALRVLAVGVLSAALPFALEMSALRRLSARAYGVLTSLEPAVATAVGVVALGQALHATDAVATLLVVTSSVATALSSRTSSA